MSILRLTVVALRYHLWRAFGTLHYRRCTIGLSLIGRIGSALDEESVESIVQAVDRLCRDYSSTRPVALIPKVQQRLAQIQHLLSVRLSLAQHRRLLNAAGWLHMLLTCLHNDL